MKGFALRLVLFLFAACVASTGWAQGRAISITTEGQSFINQLGQFVGTATFWLDGDDYAVNATTTLLAVRSLPDGTQVARTSHHYDFGGGDTFLTYDHVLLIPTGAPGVFFLQSQQKIIGGTGAFNNATGHLRPIYGTVNFITGEAVWSTTGILVPR